MNLQQNKKNKTIAEKVGKSNGRFKKFFYIGLFLLIVFFVVLVYIYAQKPARGTIIKEVQNINLQEQGEDVPKVFEGKYVSFLYENSYILKSHDTAVEDEAIILEQAYLSQNSAISKKIGIVIRNLPTHNLDDCPDFKMRSIREDDYKKENFDFGKNSGISFEATKATTFEKTFFMQNNDYLAIITMTAPSLPDENLQAESKAIIKSLSWLK